MKIKLEETSRSGSGSLEEDLVEVGFELGQTFEMDKEKFLDIFRQVNQFDKANGLEFEVHAPGEITYSMTIQEMHLSTPKTSHGAVIAGFMDCVLGLTSLSYAITTGNLCSTVEFKLNFIKPAHLGDRLVGRGKIEYHGKTLVIASGEILRESGGDVIAKGLGTFNLYPMSKKTLEVSV